MSIQVCWGLFLFFFFWMAQNEFLENMKGRKQMEKN